MHRTVAQVLRAHCLEAPEQAWYASLPLVEFAVNSTVNVSTGYSPFYLLYGEAVPLPIDHALLNDDQQQTTAHELITHVQKVVKSAQSAMQRAQQQQKVQYDRHHTPTEFQVGDWVYLSTKNLQLPGSRKLGPRFIGPMQVLKRVGTQAYKLDMPVALKQHHPVFHVALLKPAFEPPCPSTPVLLPKGGGKRSDELSEDEYEVDRIVAERKREYRVRWTGYDVSEDSWVAKEDLVRSAPEVVAAWNAVKQNKG